MIALALALAAARIPPVADAERAFAAQAQREGQWRAFLAWADPEAVMFAPEMVKARDFLAKLPEPQVTVMWWPAQTITSCDGTLAVSTGPWTIGGKAHGTFTTIWRYGPDGWKWLYDSGRDTPEAVATGGKVKALRASCQLSRLAAKPGIAAIAPEGGVQEAWAAIADGLPIHPRPDTVIQYDDTMPRLGGADIRLAPAGRLIEGASSDGSLVYRVIGLADGGKGAHALRVATWNGGAYDPALVEIVGVKPPSAP